MAKSIFDSAARQALLERLDRLTPESPARWGQFTAPKMVSHLIAAVRMGLGEITPKPRPGIMSNPVVRYLLIYVAPWPKGAPTAPEMLSRPPESWPSDLATLKSLVDRAAANGRGGTWKPHPAFGAISGDDWGVLIHKHVAHHLTQFGV
jgi:hypothetical protein